MLVYINAKMKGATTMNDMTELEIRKEKYVQVREILRKTNLWCYGASAYGHEDEYVGDHTWIFESGYATQLFPSWYSGFEFRIGWWDYNVNVSFGYGESYVREVDDEESVREFLDEIATWQLF